MSMVNSRKVFLDSFIKTIKINFNTPVNFYGVFTSSSVSLSPGFSDFNYNVHTSLSTVFSIQSWMKVIAKHTPVMLSPVNRLTSALAGKPPNHIKVSDIGSTKVSALPYLKATLEQGLGCFVHTAVFLPLRNSVWHKVDAQEICWMKV